MATRVWCESRDKRTVKWCVSANVLLADVTSSPHVACFAHSFAQTNETEAESNMTFQNERCEMSASGDHMLSSPFGRGRSVCGASGRGDGPWVRSPSFLQALSRHDRVTRSRRQVSFASSMTSSRFGSLFVWCLRGSATKNCCAVRNDARPKEQVS